MPILLITGSSGLVGSACVRHFSALGWKVIGLDNSGRRAFFGPAGDTTLINAALCEEFPAFQFYPTDITDRSDVFQIVERFAPHLLIHTAAQPSHDYAAEHPFEDFSTNAFGTLNLLEATRRHAPGAVFCFLSTNKVYGTIPNKIFFQEGSTRYDHLDPAWPGISESCPIDASMHSLFGCSKLAADLYTQEYGRYFGLKTCCFRAGCLTGRAHAAVEQHGFLAYLARCVREGWPYTIHGYKGKQVRDQLHAIDVARACQEFYQQPRPGEIYNLGGGRANSISILEAIEAFEDQTGKQLAWKNVDQPRRGDHLCYISDTRKFQRHYPGWSVSRTLSEILDELAGK